MIVTTYPVHFTLNRATWPRLQCGFLFGSGSMQMKAFRPVFSVAYNGLPVLPGFA